jgi:hypothetical protein
MDDRRGDVAEVGVQSTEELEDNMWGAAYICEEGRGIVRTAVEKVEAERDDGGDGD